MKEEPIWLLSVPQLIPGKEWLVTVYQMNQEEETWLAKQWVSQARPSSRGTDDLHCSEAADDLTKGKSD